jgi:hypothetical protein
MGIWRAGVMDSLSSKCRWFLLYVSRLIRLMLAVLVATSLRIVRVKLATLYFLKFKADDPL